jgi:hypothetical protein
MAEPRTIIGGIDIEVGNENLDTALLIPTIIGMDTVEGFIALDGLFEEYNPRAVLESIPKEVYTNVAVLSVKGYRFRDIADQLGLPVNTILAVARSEQFKATKETILEGVKANTAGVIQALTFEAVKELALILKTGRNKEKLKAVEMIFDYGGMEKKSSNISINQKIEQTPLSSEELMNILGNNPDFAKAISAIEGTGENAQPDTSGTE